MMTTTKGADMTATLNTFTDQTWTGLGNQGLTRETSPRFWQNLHDLAVEAYETTKDFCSLTFPEWNALVSAASSGLPIVLTTEHTYENALTGAERTERTKQTCMVDQIMSLSGRTTANLYIRTWGFAHPIALGDLVAVEVPAVERTYS